MTPLSKRLIIALAISGALNLLAIGLFVGGAIRRSRSHGGPDHMEHRERGPRSDRSGGDEARERKHDDGPPERGWRRGERPGLGLMADHPEQVVARRRATSEARRAVREALEQEPFEAATLERSLGTLRGETAATQQLLHQSLLEAAKKGDAEKRRDLARGFERLAERPMQRP
jgi:hypothetical protein